MYIYADVLIILNIYVNYFLLKATAKLTHTMLKLGRCIIASVFGSLFSMIIFIPNINQITNIIIKLAAANIIVLIAFKNKHEQNMIKLTGFFYIINFIFAGIMFTIYTVFKPTFIYMNNTFVYMDFSLISLVVFTTAAYFIICIVRYLIDRNNYCDDKYSITIMRKGKTVILDGLADTGNSLCDNFSGKPVIVCGKKSITNIIEPYGNISISDDAEKILSDFSGLNGLRLIPYSTIGNLGVIPVFVADEVVIKQINRNRTKKVDALIGINDMETKAIFNPKLLI